VLEVCRRRNSGSLSFLSLGAGGAAKALYDVEPSEIPGSPGSVIRIWPLEGGGPGMGGNGEAFRILYRSTDPERSSDSRIRRDLHPKRPSSRRWAQPPPREDAPRADATRVVDCGELETAGRC
jgi:hypothetical protein